MPKIMEGQMKLGQYRKMNDSENKILQKAMQEMEPNKSFYPDANFTQRVSYGQIKGMTPRDGMQYDWFTTIDGVIAKEKPEDREFKVPAKLSQLYNNKDFGNYTDKKSGKLQTCFLSTNDITGGNSGSPVIDGNGRIIGIAFDGNWEGAAGDLYSDKNLNRTISVDIRYVLFTIDKFGGCGYLLNELKLK
jgi:V8-like Glu-specific endopeptidase